MKKNGIDFNLNKSCKQKENEKKKHLNNVQMKNLSDNSVFIF